MASAAQEAKHGAVQDKRATDLAPNGADRTRSNRWSVEHSTSVPPGSEETDGRATHLRQNRQGGRKARPAAAPRAEYRSGVGPGFKDFKPPAGGSNRRKPSWDAAEKAKARETAVRRCPRAARAREKVRGSSLTPDQRPTPTRARGHHDTRSTPNFERRQM